jgi:hypothetical protein
MICTDDHVDEIIDKLTGALADFARLNALEDRKA